MSAVYCFFSDSPYQMRQTMYLQFCMHEGSSVTSSFLISLAVADLLFLLVCVPFEMTSRLAIVWAGGLALCKVAGFVEMLSAASSVLNLTAVSAERYDAQYAVQRLSNARVSVRLSRRLTSTACRNLCAGSRYRSTAAGYRPISAGARATAAGSVMLRAEVRGST